MAMPGHATVMSGQSHVNCGGITASVHSDVSLPSHAPLSGHSVLLM